MTIKMKILGLVAAFAVLAGAITALSLVTMADYGKSLAAFSRTADNAMRAERLNRRVMAVALEARTLYLTTSQAEAGQIANRLDNRAAELEGFIASWTSRLRPGELPQFEAVAAQSVVVGQFGHQLARIAREQGPQTARRLGNKPEYHVYRERLQADIDIMVAHVTSEQSRSQAELARFEASRQLQFFVMAGSGILLLLAGSLWIALDAIANPLARVRESMVRISEGAYDTPIPTGAKRGEIGELWTALGILKARAIEAERLSREQIEQEHRLRELVLD